MKSNELRIGNCVFEDERLVILHDGFGIDHAHNFDPIELTEEWLLNFGFDNVRKNLLICHNEYHNNRINEGVYYVEPVGDAFNNWYLYHKVKMITSNIRYVHQLQNLYFALTGEELTLKN